MDGLVDHSFSNALQDDRAAIGSERSSVETIGMPPMSGWLPQRTLKTAIDCVGVGLHSGRRINMTLRPAEPGTGIVFRRTDLNGVEIPARFDHVTDTRLCTVIGLPGNAAARVGTIEHVMAALAGSGIDNALIDVDGPELPILDGSSAPLVFLIDCAGISEQIRPQSAIEILRPVRVEDGRAFAELRPANGATGFTMAFSISFDAPAIGKQARTITLTPAVFRRELARARTFTLASEVASLHAAGLGLGGSMDNAIVVEHDRVLNPGGLRMPDEFVRHKLLDAVGDLALAGAPLIGRFVAHRSGHGLNNRLLRALFAQAGAWRTVQGPALPGWLSAAA